MKTEDLSARSARARLSTRQASAMNADTSPATYANAGSRRQPKESRAAISVKLTSKSESTRTRTISTLEGCDGEST